MRHRVYGKKLGLHKDQRDVLFKSLVYHLFSYGTIQTSETKAKAIKGLVDKIINLAKSKNSRRLVQSYFNNKLLEERLTKELLPKLQSRRSGYTSLVRLGKRLGDNSMMVRMSLIGVGELRPVKKQLSVLSGQLSDRGSSVASKPDKQKTGKLNSENRKPKTDNRGKAASSKTKTIAKRRTSK
ncbi:50S ribosomal protein L17 [Candidatus Daviesbacteria bacterium]|nr:50S ribosomal protein L17 [Candidatus Daviesbacteria bacterium]